MKAGFFTLGMLLMLLNACTSIKELADQGRYDEVIIKGTKKLKGKDLKDPVVVGLIERAFNQANEKDLNIIRSFNADNDWRTNEKVLRITRAISHRQDMIKPYLPLTDANGYTAHFDFVNIAQINGLATKNIVEDLYNEGMALLDQSKRSDYKLARQAYHLFEKIEDYRPAFKDLYVLKSDALRQGRSHVRINIVNNSYGLLPIDVKQLFREYLTVKKPSKWVAFHFDNDKNEEADYRINISLQDLDVSPERVHDTYHHFSEEVQDGFTYKLDSKGNVMKDSSGNDIKVPAYKRINASVREVSQKKEAVAEMQIELIDNHTGKIVERNPLRESSLFSNYAVMYTGDKRALPENWSCKIGGFIQTFPTDEMLVDQVLASLGSSAGRNLENLQREL